MIHPPSEKQPQWHSCCWALKHNHGCTASSPRCAPTTGLPQPQLQQPPGPQGKSQLPNGMRRPRLAPGSALPAARRGAVRRPLCVQARPPPSNLEPSAGLTFKKVTCCGNPIMKRWAPSLQGGQCRTAQVPRFSHHNSTLPTADTATALEGVLSQDNQLAQASAWQRKEAWKP